MKGSACRTRSAVRSYVCKLLGIRRTGSYNFISARSMQTAVFTHTGPIPINHFVARVTMVQQRLYFQAKLVMIVAKLDK